MKESVIFQCPCGDWLSADFEPGYPDTRWEPGQPDYWYVNIPEVSENGENVTKLHLKCLTDDRAQEICYQIANESWGETYLEFWPNDLVEIPS